MGEGDEWIGVGVCICGVCVGDYGSGGIMVCGWRGREAKEVRVPS